MSDNVNSTLLHKRCHNELFIIQFSYSTFYLYSNLIEKEDLQISEFIWIVKRKLGEGFFFNLNMVPFHVRRVLHSLTFWYFHNFRKFSQNLVPQLWYFVKCVYFGLSAYQIRCGYPTRVLGNFLTKSYNYVNLFLFQG